MSAWGLVSRAQGILSLVGEAMTSNDSVVGLVMSEQYRATVAFKWNAFGRTRWLRQLRVHVLTSTIEQNQN